VSKHRKAIIDSFRVHTQHSIHKMSQTSGSINPGELFSVKGLVALVTGGGTGKQTVSEHKRLSPSLK
jgi:hypothetical protein